MIGLLPVGTACVSPDPEMNNHSVRKPKAIPFSSQDTLVIFGEVFEGGYVTGLIESARAQGMKIIYSTVGKRSPEGTLRKLSPEEGSSYPQPLVNVPLEAGFDRQPSKTGQSPLEMCQRAGLKDMESFSIEDKLLEESRRLAREDFRHRVRQWLKELLPLLPDRGNVLIAHTMAGGVPRAKVLLPLLNRVFKGRGERFYSSEKFWLSGLGRLCEKNFSEVTAQTYHHLLDLSTSFREKLQKQNRQVFYMGYSYHGTEVLTGDQYQWQSYAPYLQGFAKKELEQISTRFSRQGVKSCVFNVPEILTKSSAIFPGLQVPLYTLPLALKKEKATHHLVQNLSPGVLEKIRDITFRYFTSQTVKKQSVFEKWPQHNNREYSELLLDTSKALSDLTENSLNIPLSGLILKSTGRLILQNVMSSKQAVLWIGHEGVARDTSTS